MAEQPPHLLRFTVVNPNDNSESILKINQGTKGNTHVVAPNTPLILSQQQLGELGWLFISLAGKIDLDSAVELIDGYGLELPNELSNLS